jgi:hypothetical protein
MEKNPNYWNKGLPYLDGIEFYNLLPFSPELGSCCESLCRRRLVSAGPLSAT